MHAFVRRLGAGLTTTVVATLATTGVLVAPAAQAAPNSYAYSGGTWLSDQLTDGVVHNDQYDFDDYGLSLDVFFALHALDTRPGAQDSVLDALAVDPAAYTDAFGYASAGATGKLTTAVLADGRDATSFGGTDLVQLTEDRVHVGNDAENGRGVANADDYPNTIVQGWVVRALVGAGSDLADDATDFLLKQQCAAGFFRESQEATGSQSTFTCDAATDKTPSIDSTAFAVQALEAAAAAGDTDAQPAIDKAITWLVSQQGASGAFVGNDVANSNTTGLAAWVLADEGRTGAAGNAAGWLQRLQVTDAVAESTALANELGAVAYDAPALAAGKSDGIVTETRDQWRRATAQAVVGLDAALPAKTLTVTAPSGYQDAGTQVTLHVSGLAPGERFALTLGGTTTRGTAGSSGVGTALVTLPKGTATYQVAATGSRTSRAGSTVLKALGAKTLGLYVRHRPIDRGDTQYVTVSGLASGEYVRLVYRGTQIWSGYATSTGTAKHSFPATGSLGVAKLVGYGRFSDRTVATTFTVR